MDTQKKLRGELNTKATKKKLKNNKNNQQYTLRKRKRKCHKICNKT